MFRIKERETIFVPQIAMNYIFFYPENKTHFLLLLYCLPLTKLKKKEKIFWRKMYPTKNIIRDKRYKMFSCLYKICLVCL